MADVKVEESHSAFEQFYVWKLDAQLQNILGLCHVREFHKIGLEESVGSQDGVV